MYNVRFCKFTINWDWNINFEFSNTQDICLSIIKIGIKNSRYAFNRKVGFWQKKKLNFRDNIRAEFLNSGKFNRVERWSYKRIQLERGIEAKHSLNCCWLWGCQNFWMLIKNHYWGELKKSKVFFFWLNFPLFKLL